jgi:parallel beta-helix repeat protein
MDGPKSVTATFTAAATVADFTGVPTSGNVPLDVLFTDASTGTITSYAWDFGSGASPATADTVGPHTVTYSTSGLKTVVLTVTGPGGTDTKTKTDYIDVLPPAPVANFSADKRSASGYTDDTSLTVNFTDESTGTITSWAWDFDNDTVVDSTDQNPSYTYSGAGKYTVKLTVTGPDGSDSETKTDFIRIVESANRIYVSSTGGVDTNDGSTWALAKKTIQAALTAASDDYTVLVAAGTYSIAGDYDLDFAGKAIHLKGVFFEGFESNNLTANSWTATGWATSTADKHSNTYSARSAPTGTSTNPIYKTFNIGAGGGTVTFWWKATVATTSYLRFLIDGSDQGVKATTSWASKTYSLSEGSRILRWECVRGAAGAITAYLDDIEVTNASPSGCQIDCLNTAGRRAFVFDDSETALSVVDSIDIYRGNASTDDGGGIYAYAASPTIMNSKVWVCRGTNGGGISCDSGANLTIIGCTLIANVASDGDGGGIYCFDSSPLIKGCTIGVAASANTASNNGGGLSCDSNSNPRVAGCTFDSNSVTWWGGAMACVSGSSPKISDCIITSNVASDQAGGIYLATDANAIISGCTITGNTTDWYGAGMYIESSTPTLSGCEISSNNAGDTGGGIYFWSSSSQVLNCKILSNSAVRVGGGIECDNSSSPAITNCLIAGNTTSATLSGDGNGAGIDLYYYSNATLTNCTIADNTVSGTYGDGGGIYCSVSSPVLNNSIVWGNLAVGLGNQICTWKSGSYVCEVTLNYSDYADNTVDANNIKGSGTVTANDCIVSDPVFVGGGDYHLDSITPSPCIDAGDNSLVPSGVTTDLDGLMRIYNSTVDMGAYESQPAP